MGKMKNSGTSETMQTLMRKSVCAMLSLLLLLSAVLPVKAAAETAPAKVVRVGSFEDTFNYVNERGARKGYGYELLETLSGYTGWQFEYVTCDWSDCFEKLKNGEIDIMGDISYTEDRAEEMLFSDEPMGEEKYYLYADFSRTDISASNFKTLNGKKIGVLMGTEPEEMLTEWEEKHGIKTEHVNISDNEDVKQKLANHEIDCFVSLEEAFWAELGISTMTRVGESSIYYAINKDRPDLKEELDNAMRALDEADPFYTADLYKRYFSLDYTPILTGEEKAWLRKHGAIRMGFLTSDGGVSTYDPATGKLTGAITDYIQFAAGCLGNQELEFQIVGYDSIEAELDALKSGEIDMIFHFDQNPNLAEEYRVACTSTTWITNLMAVTNKEHFNESKANRIAVPQNKLSLKKYLAFHYPQWEIVDCDTQEDAAKLIETGRADCFVTGISSEENYSKKYGFYSVPLLNPVKSCFAVNSGNCSLLSILNKTIKAKPINLLAGSIAMYQSSARKVTLSEVCTNLVSNAVKYTGACGTIHCDITQKPGKKEGWCDTVITVADNGIGMSQEFQKHIFEPFERERTSTVSKVEGSGIGMGIVKKLVGLMGGTVEVESKIGVGSTFTVTIPCRIASQEETQAKRDTTSSDKKSLSGTKILLAEDNDLNAEIAVELLQEEGCTVDRAKDGVECVDMLEKAANGTYQLILMDIQMPVMNGYDAAKKIRRMDDLPKADIPIIAMTANAFSEDKQAALDAGMNDHVAKPINRNVLVPAIQKYL